MLKIVEDSLQRNAMGPSRDESQGGRFTTRGMLRRDAMQPFLADVRRRVRTELAMLRPRRIATGRGRAAAAAQRVGRRAQVVREQLSRRREILARGIRRKITGAEETRVRDYVRDILEEPPVVRLRDKMSFLLGVVGCFIVEAVALKAPQQFWICYTICMLPLLALRGYLYKRINQHYFLIGERTRAHAPLCSRLTMCCLSAGVMRARRALMRCGCAWLLCVADFCYASNASCLVQLLAYPTSSRLFQANFLLTTGPLAMAVPTWRNSLVFHSLDRVTSSYIHTLPPLLTFCLRWFPPPALDVNDDLPFVEAFFGAMLFYCAWQGERDTQHARDTKAVPSHTRMTPRTTPVRAGFYLLHTEWLFPPATQLDTSIRVLASGKKDTPPPACYSGITGLTYRAMATIGVMRHAERFDSEHWKTKTIFVGAQLLYTAATLLLAYGLWSSFRAHLAYLLAILACCVWSAPRPNEGQTRSATASPWVQRTDGCSCVGAARRRRLLLHRSLLEGIQTPVRGRRGHSPQAAARAARQRQPSRRTRRPMRHTGEGRGADGKWRGSERRGGRGRWQRGWRRRGQ